MLVTVLWQCPSHDVFVLMVTSQDSPKSVELQRALKPADCAAELYRTQNIYISSDITSDMWLGIGLITSRGNDWTFQKRRINIRLKIRTVRSILS
jgi:hypothetical protein